MGELKSHADIKEMEKNDSDNEDEKEFRGLKRFNPVASIRTHSIVIILGRRFCGKSVLIRDFIYNNRHKYPVAVVFCPTEGNNNFYKEFIPDIFIYDELSPEAFDRILERQKTITNINTRPPWINEDNDTLLIILDDCMSEKKANIMNENIKYIFQMGRHVKICLFVVVQYLNDLPPALRNNAEVVCVLNENSDKNRKLLKEYVGGFESQKHFDQIHNKYTNNYGCLVANRSSGDKNIESQLFWYRAKFEIPPFKLGEDIWNFEKQHYIRPGDSDLNVNWDEFNRNPDFHLQNSTGGSSKKQKGGSKSKEKEKKKPYDVLLFLGEDGAPIGEDEN